MFEYLNIFLVNMYRFLFIGFMIANVSSVFYIPKERTPQQNCRNIITQYMESLMMLRQEYPSSVLHQAWKKDTPACTFTCSTTDRGRSTTPQRFALPTIFQRPTAPSPIWFKCQEIWEYPQPAFLETVYGCRIIYRTSDENMARLPGGDPF